MMVRLTVPQQAQLFDAASSETRQAIDDHNQPSAPEVPGPSHSLCEAGNWRALHNPGRLCRSGGRSDVSDAGRFRMCKHIKTVTTCLGILVVLLAAPAGAKKRNRARQQEKEITESTPAILWRNPTDICSRDVFYGPGGKQD